MPRTGARLRIDKGIYRNGPEGTYEIRVMVGGTPYTDTAPSDSDLNELRAKRAALEAKGRTETPRAHRESLRAAVPTFLRLISHLASADKCAQHCRDWCAELGNLPRHRITADDVQAVRETWRRAGLSPKTIKNRIDTLRNLYHRLDGKKAPTPCDDITLPKPAKTIIQRVSDELILAVDAKLQERERDPTKQFDGAKTRARFRVFVSTGKRPCEIMRAEPGDVDLEHRVWVPRDAKGGYCPGVYLNDDMRAAWQLFIEADAWGPFNHGNFGRVLRSAGWPKGVRPYQARHTAWITASERGVPLEDVSVGAGHRDMRTTRRAYVPVLNSRLQQMSERMDGRFQGWPEAGFAGPNLGTANPRTPVRRNKTR